MNNSIIKEASEMTATRHQNNQSIRLQNDGPYQIRVQQNYRQNFMPINSAIQNSQLIRSSVMDQKAFLHNNLPLNINHNNVCAHGHQSTFNQPPQYINYQQPILVKQEWQRPLDSRVKEQEWRFVRTKEQQKVQKEVVVKYLTKLEQPVQVVQRHQVKRVMAAPSQLAAVPEVKTCSPLIFLLLGLLALIGLIVGLILLSSSGKVAPTDIKSPISQTNPISIIEDGSLDPIVVSPIIAITNTTNSTISTTNSNSSSSSGVTSPSISPISSAPLQKVSTIKPTITSASQSTISQLALTSSSSNSTSTTINVPTINQQNLYQVRPTTQPSHLRLE